MLPEVQRRKDRSARLLRCCAVLCYACRVLPDLMGRTLQIVTHEKEELVCFVQKSTKALIMEVGQEQLTADEQCRDCSCYGGADAGRLLPAPCMRVVKSRRD